MYFEGKYLPKNLQESYVATAENPNRISEIGKVAWNVGKVALLGEIKIYNERLYYIERY